mgnify:CR=1 FL=1
MEQDHQKTNQYKTMNERRPSFACVGISFLQPSAQIRLLLLAHLSAQIHVHQHDVVCQPCQIQSHQLVVVYCPTIWLWDRLVPIA